MCARCEDLEAEVAWLRSELGLQTTAADIAAMCEALNVRPQCAELLLVLRAANGRPVTGLQIMERVSGKEDKGAAGHYPSVLVHFARKALGPDLIENVWGKGYRLTPEGVARLNALLPAKPARPTSAISERAA